MTMVQTPRHVPETPSKLKTQIAATEALELPVAKPRRRSSVSSTSSTSSEEDRSVVQAYCLAGKVRRRLRYEVDQPVGSLRRLVGHVNVLDDIMDIIYNDELQEDSSFPDLALLEREPSHSSNMLLLSVDDDEWDEDDSEDYESTENSGLVIKIRELRNSAPQRPAPQRPALIASKA